MLEISYEWLVISFVSIAIAFFAAGWISARIDIKELLKEARQFSSYYFKGVNSLITRDYEQATLSFSEAIRHHPDSLELHFILGSLFRLRGETEKAITLHLQLLHQENIALERKEAIKIELAQDYFNAGMFDRAEVLLCELQKGSYQQEALHYLFEIYRKQRDWQLAIDVARKIESVSGNSFHVEIAHFHCELAQQYALKQEIEQARLQLQKALKAHPTCVRANLLLGEMETSERNALFYWREIETQNASYLSLVADKILQFYEKLGNKMEGMALIRQQYKRYHLPSLLDIIFRESLHSLGSHDLSHWLMEELNTNPNLKTLSYLVKVRLLIEPSEELFMTQMILGNVLTEKHIHLCKHCGFRARSFHWQCPACNQWESLPPESHESTV